MAEQNGEERGEASTQHAHTGEPRVVAQGAGSGQACARLISLARQLALDAALHPMRNDHQGTWAAFERAIVDAAAENAQGATEPEPMVLFCPVCKTQYPDTEDWATKPHRKHLCLWCGHIWKPHEHATVGIAVPNKSETDHQHVYDKSPEHYEVRCLVCGFNPRAQGLPRGEK
jgi:hypothetical protein